MDTMSQVRMKLEGNRKSEMNLYSYLSKDSYILELSNNKHNECDQDRFDMDRFEYESHITGGN